MTVLEQIRELESQKQALLQKGIEKCLVRTVETLRELKALVRELKNERTTGH